MTATLTPPAPPKPAPVFAPQGPTFPSAPDWPPLYRFTVEQYGAMIAAGILPEGGPLELLYGLVVEKMSKNYPHIFATRRLGDRLRPILPPAWLGQSQDPIVLDDSEPEPDHAVCSAHVLEALARKPRAAEVALVAEVADSSLLLDRRSKKSLYARSHIPVYWIVNIPDRRVEVYTDPSGPGLTPDYATRDDFGLGDSVPVVIMGVEVGRIPVADLFVPAGATP